MSELAAERRRNGGERVIGLGAVGAASLRHVGLAAAALAPKHRRCFAHQVNGRDTRYQIGCYTDHNAGLAVLTGGDERHDAGPKLFLALVGKAFQVLDVDAGNRARHQLDIADHSHAVGALAPGTATHGELLLGLGELALQLAPFIDHLSKTARQILN